MGVFCFSDGLALHTARACGWVAQLAEQWTENPRVGGSIPPPATVTSIDLAGALEFYRELAGDELFTLLKIGILMTKAVLNFRL